jgi:agmatine deiminase
MINTNNVSSYRIPANWEPCDAILLVWPFIEESSDEIFDLYELYEALASVLPDYADLIILVQPDTSSQVMEHLQSIGASLDHITFYEINASDINMTFWSPLIVESADKFLFLKQQQDKSAKADFFQHLFACAEPLLSGFNIVKGLLETNGNDQLLLNKSAWFQINPDAEIQSFIKFIQDSCNINHLIAIESPDKLSHLPVRLCPNNRLLVTRCTDTESSWYQAFDKFNEQLQAEVLQSSIKFEIVDLPWIGEITNSDGRSYFADYSQFLILNEAIFLPLFDLPTDEDAMEILSEAFPGFDILGFPSSALSLADTSLMKIHFPVVEGVLEPL